MKTRSLTETVIRAARPNPAKIYKLKDAGARSVQGLYLHVFPNASKLWRLRYRFGGKEQMLALGRYPIVDLLDARIRANDAFKAVAGGVDPAAARRTERAAARPGADPAGTVGAIAEEWLAKKDKEIRSAAQLRRRFDQYVKPHLGGEPIATVTAPDVLAVLRRLEGRGRLATAQRVREILVNVFAYAIATGRATVNAASDLNKVIAAPSGSHYAAVTDPKAVAGLLRAIDSYQGNVITAHALRLAPYLFVRPGELRAAEWSEFDLEADHPVWRIPAARTKMRDAHVVPLAPQAIAILRELRRLTGGGRYLFPSTRAASAADRPMSDGTVNAALRRMGFDKTEMTGHGFRSMASTLLNEQGFAPDVIELQLAHKERNKVRGAYNRATRLEERRRMMTAWADYLDALRAGATNVVAIGVARAS